MQYAEALARTVTRHSRVYLMKHRALTLSYLLFASVHAAGQGSVLCIVADDVGIDRIAAYGGTALGLHPDPGKTPQIDRLASRGVMFRNAWSSPVCSVARAAMLTGRFGFRTGVGDNIDVGHLGTAIQASEVCLPEILKLGTGGAYTSVGIGKWHLGTSLDGNAHPLSVGFDAHFGLKRGFGQGNYYRWRKLVNGTSYPTFRYATTDSVDDALRAFEASTGPAFVWLSFNAPHRPFHRPPSRLHSFALSGPPDDTPVDHMKAMVEAMDTEIGRLLSSLPAGHADELTVIFIGDNGTSPYATDAPFSPDHAKGTLFEGGIRVPLIIA
ncbi:MAG: arylsulfatase A-like enzyme [Planctomycetota bacterium]|jgi:arylsulfatase A-like enzyme